MDSSHGNKIANDLTEKPAVPDDMCNNVTEESKPKVEYKFYCAFCCMGYNQRLYHRYEFDCCSTYCINIVCEEMVKATQDKINSTGNGRNISRFHAGGGF